MKYEITGPFNIWRDDKRITKKSVKKFWNVHRAKPDDDAYYDDSFNGAGCYMFASRSGSGYKPLYIGKTKRTFYEEIFTADKIVKFNEVLKKNSGTPVIFLIAMQSESGNYVCGKKGEIEINFLELFFIYLALQKNPNLINYHRAQFIRNIKIPGLFNNTARRKKSEKEFLNAILKKSRSVKIKKKPITIPKQTNKKIVKLDNDHDGIESMFD